MVIIELVVKPGQKRGTVLESMKNLWPKIAPIPVLLTLLQVVQTGLQWGTVLIRMSLT